MQRITSKDLQGAVNLLNRITNNPAEPYSIEHGETVASIGNFHISGAYGGFALHQMANHAGGIRDIFQQGHMPMRELYNLIHAYRKGIQFAQEQAEREAEEGLTYTRM
jgi:hypothetical protein